MTKSKRDTRCTFEAITRHLIFQLADQHSDFLRQWEHEIEDALRSPEWKHQDLDIAFASMTSFLMMLSAAFAEGMQVTIVIDRLDACAWGDPLREEVDALDKAVWSLSNLVKDLSPNQLHVKVLLVMDDIAGSRIAGIMKGQKGSTIDWKVDWDQEAE
ncbi:hypothetical protein LTR27_007277 [Elasticomyces elasticus]|nr:hypothetical protein LTR27_007277 [Elasticomyces elasticus]